MSLEVVEVRHVLRPGNGNLDEEVARGGEQGEGAVRRLERPEGPAINDVPNGGVEEGERAERRQESPCALGGALRNGVADQEGVPVKNLDRESVLLEVVLPEVVLQIKKAREMRAREGKSGTLRVAILDNEISWPEEQIHLDLFFHKGIWFSAVQQL